MLVDAPPALSIYDDTRIEEAIALLIAEQKKEEQEKAKEKERMEIAASQNKDKQPEDSNNEPIQDANDKTETAVQNTIVSKDTLPPENVFIITNIISRVR